MKTHTKIIYGIKVVAYNDSNASWNVQAGDMLPQSFDKRKWTMKDAIKFAAKIAA